ncbi:Serine/threonine-protein phosphatase 2A regulatory subunit B'' subunit alpha [Microtus ochrogaster]|uniref:Serine/threonine-protein phosphatase 2A regulatory subunit B'' subunit alpha n=1 Tax=Microtus ochrogaster TaxID=79684 RepID=A0A8J6G9L2_MICOH|nr:Serine/threonine-protein phosphatase 2A regulatory subunit B'' subunit alpha [Microtus ochrogaster]
MQSGNNEAVDLTELVSSISNLQLTPFSPIYGTEQPPKYEDVVHLSALDSRQFHPVELQDNKHNFKQTDIEKATPNNTNSLCSLEVNTSGTLKPVQLQSSSLTMNPLENVSSSNLMETLYIEEESDGKKSLLGKEQKTENGQGQNLLKVNEHKEFSDHDTHLKKHPTSVQNEIGKVFEKPMMVHPPKEESKLEVPTIELKDQRHFMNPNSQEEIDKLLMDLESFSQKMETSLGEPLAKGESISSLNSHSRSTGQIHNDLESKPIDCSPAEKVSPSCLTRIIENNGHKIEEEDRALLLRILESIEDFAQELVDCKSGRGSLSQEKEMMQILQETLTTSSQASPPVCRSSVGEKTKDNASVVLIQQTPEVIKLAAATASHQSLAHYVVSPPCRTMSYVSVDTSSESTDKDLKEMKEVVEEAVNGRGAPANGNASEESIDEEEEEGDGKAEDGNKDEQTEAPMSKQIQNKPEKKPASPLPSAAALPSSPQPASPTPRVNDAVTAPLSINIPQFYFPDGLPDTCSNYEQILTRVETAFMDIEDQKADIYEMGKIAKVCGCPLYWKAPMFRAAGGEKTGFVTAQSFIAMWKKLLNNHHDDASKFIWLLAKPSCSYLEQEDFIPLLQDVVDTHPGLTFLKDAPEFHSRYITTTLALLEEEEDINQITDYFSYEHFYVIYCKFWELDGDHDLYISQADLSRYNDQASSSRIIERIFSGAVTSIEYWFRCMDVDGDGILSMYELEYFYEEQCERMEAMGIEPLPFHDLLCQMLDLVKPASDGKITLRDLKRCRMAHIFYDTFFNLEKYLDHEQRDPFAVQKDVENDGPEPSDWDRFAAEEYEALVTEESAQVQLQEG